MKKYELTDETKVLGEITLHRIKALRVIENSGRGRVLEGELGGWLESEYNLSQEGGCWVAEEAKVYGRAHVRDNALVCGKAAVSEQALVRNISIVCDRACVFQNAVVSQAAQVKEAAVLKGRAFVGGVAVVKGSAVVEGCSRVIDDALVWGFAEIGGSSVLLGGAVSSREIYYSNFIYGLTLSDNHITYGCETRTVEGWIAFLESNETISTPRDSPKFKIIRLALELAIEQWRKDREV